MSRIECALPQPLHCIRTAATFFYFEHRVLHTICSPFSNASLYKLTQSSKNIVYSFLQKSVFNDMYHLDGWVCGKLANGMATAVQIAHSVNGLATVPIFHQLFVNRFAAANHTQTQPSKLYVICIFRPFVLKPRSLDEGRMINELWTYPVIGWWYNFTMERLTIFSFLISIWHFSTFYYRQ